MIARSRGCDPRVTERSGPTAASIALCLLLSVAALCWTVGCATAPRVGATADDGDWLSLTMDWQDSGAGRFARYVVARDGTIAFGGGFDAANRRTTWSGPLAPDDRAMLWAVLREDGWLDRELSGSGEPADVRATVRIASAEGDRRQRIRGASSEVQRLREALDHASRGRFESTMRMLPRAGDPQS